jgi:hypothetical protein
MHHTLLLEWRHQKIRQVQETLASAQASEHTIQTIVEEVNLQEP